jgi:hypothetical protein
MALSIWFPWVITALSFFGMWLIGNKNKQGFALNVLLNSAMIPYNMVTGQYGFVPGGAVAACFALRNYLKWARSDSDGEKCACGEGGSVARR